MPSRTRSLASLCVSLVLHLGIALVLIFRLAPRPPNTLQTPNLQIEIRETSVPMAGDKNGRSAPHRSERGKTLKDLMPSGWPSARLLGRVGSAAGGGGLLRPFGEGSGDLGRLKDFSLYDRVYQAIDEYLIYPSALSFNKIEGSAQVQLLLKPSGEIDWSSVRLSGTNKYVQIYVFRVLRRIFAQPFAPHVTRGLKSPLQFDLIFDFRLSESDLEEVKKKKNFIMGQVLSFYRLSHQSRLQWRLGPLSGFGPTPFVSLDLGWIIRQIEGDDPLARFLAEGDL